MIRYLLTFFGLLVIAYGLREWRRSRLVGLSLVVISLVGMFFVWFPAVADEIAALAGVTRGADLVLYCYSATSFVLLLNLALKQRELQQSITGLARHISLSTAQCPGSDVPPPVALPGADRREH